MVKYCIEKWNENKDKLEQAIRSKIFSEESEYEVFGLYQYLVQFVVKYVLNPGADERDRYSTENITVINAGDYSGEMLFVIPKEETEWTVENYLLTYIEYGSCALCDTLEAILDEDDKEQKVKDYMYLCKDILCNIIKPYNDGSHEDERFFKCTYDCDEECDSDGVSMEVMSAMRILLEEKLEKKAEETHTFKEIRRYFSRTERVSICCMETLQYENYDSVEDVPAAYDNKWLYGFGNIESEFDDTFKSCVEIMLSDSPRKFIKNGIKAERSIIMGEENDGM